MKIIRMDPNPSGAYPSPQDWPDGESIPEGFAVLPEGLDMGGFYTAKGFVTLTVQDQAVTSYAVNQEALDAWSAEHPDPDPTEALAVEVRSQRDELLADTDWTQVLDAPIDATSREAYRTYRQALRDIPEQPGFPGDIIWPELPAVGKAAPDPVDAAFDTLIGGDGNA